MFTLILLIFTITLGFWLFQKKRNSSLKAFKIAPKKRLVLENWPKMSTVKSWRYRDLDPSWMNCFLIGLRSKRFRASLSRNLVVLLSLQLSGNSVLETLATQATFSYAVILAWNLVRIRLQNETSDWLEYQNWNFDFPDKQILKRFQNSVLSCFLHMQQWEKKKSEGVNRIRDKVVALHELYSLS